MGKTTMQFLENGNFHKGFYLCSFEEMRSALAGIRNTKWNFSDDDDGQDGFAYEDANVFRMGSCQLFSLALSQELGLTAYELRGEKNNLIHAFCVFEFLRKKVYVDVRGATSDLSEFLKGLYLNSKERPTCVLQDVDKEKDNLSSDERWGYEFALDIIRRNPDFYTAERC